MKRILFVTTLIIAFNSGLFAQFKQATISFAQEKHDFGTIKEHDGMVAFKFDFTNTGGTPLVINQVEASCGCTTPKWSREPIPPGGKGFIDVTYNPKGRPGQFEKSITVTSNASNSPQKIYIRGMVAQEALTPERIYSVKIGALSLRQQSTFMGEVHPGGKISSSLDIYNNSADSITVTFQTPPHIKFATSPKKLGPKQKGRIDITYSATAKNEWGDNTYEFNPMINGKLATETISITVNVTEDFSKLTPEQKNAGPKAVFDKESINFNPMKKGGKFEAVYILKNTGKSPLTVRKIQTTCGCTAAKIKHTTVKSGQSTEIKLSYDSKDEKPGFVDKTAIVITNDPNKPIQMLHITGKVTE